MPSSASCRESTGEGASVIRQVAEAEARPLIEQVARGEAVADEAWRQLGYSGSLDELGWEDQS